MEVCLNCMREISPGQSCTFCKKPQPVRQEPSYALPLGFVLHDRYFIGKALGAGGFGITYAALDMASGKRVVVKESFPATLVMRREGRVMVELKIQQSSREEVVAAFRKIQESFVREAQMLSQYGRHKGLVQVYHLFEENGTAYFTMEFLDGVDLKTWLVQQGRLSWPQLSPLVGQLLDTLEYLHHRNIIHRDIAPDNIFLASDGVKLIDFGAARSTASGRKLTEIVKPGFAPPEQFRGQEQKAYTDLYALCATIYFCLTGQPPLSSMERGLQDGLIPPSQLVPGLPDRVEKCIMKGLALKPEERYQSVDQMRTALLMPVPTVTRNRNWTEHLWRLRPPVPPKPRARKILQGLNGSMEGWEIALTDQVTIGRDSQRCQLVVPASELEVSRVHCTLKPFGWFWLIRDEGSSYGTNLKRFGGTGGTRPRLTEGKRLTAGRWYLLRKGDMILLGRKEVLRFSER